MTTRPQHRLIGERGPEAVIPLHRLKGLSGGDSTSVNFNIGGLSRGLLDLPAHQQRRYIRDLVEQELSRSGGFNRAIARGQRGTLSR